MLLKTRDGIACDLCNRECKKKFTYFSIRLVRVDVDVEAKKTTNIDTDVDIDVCEFCKGKLVERIQEVVKTRGG